MTLTLTADQIAALALEGQRVLVAIKIDLATDLLYCSGGDPVTLNSDAYVPRGLRLGRAEMAEAQGSRCVIEIDDTDGVVSTVWYGERFSGQTVTVKEVIKDAGGWVVVRSIPWVCQTCERRSDGSFRMNLSGAGGFKPRAGLEVATRDDWHLAPEPGRSVRIGGGTSARV